MRKLKAELEEVFCTIYSFISEEMRIVWQRVKGLSQVGKLPKQRSASSLMCSPQGLYIFLVYAVYNSEVRILHQSI